MATFRIPILGFSTKPDNSGSVFFEPNSVKGTNDIFDELVLVFNDTAASDTVYGSFQVPQNYVGTPKFVVVWKTTATSGDVEWDVGYRAVADGESLDQASVQESLNQNDTAGGSTDLKQTTLLAATAGNFAVADTVQFSLSRDGTDAGDTIAAAVTVHSIYFEYTDA